MKYKVGDLVKITAYPEHLSAINFRSTENPVGLVGEIAEIVGLDHYICICERTDLLFYRTHAFRPATDVEILTYKLTR